jgi:hypothetical protein
MRRPLLSSALTITSALLIASSGETAAQGTEFNLSCDADEVLVGIGGRQGWWMEGIAARCRAVEAAGTLRAAVRSTPYAGGPDGEFRTFDCEPDEVMIGFAGSQGDNGHVLHVHELLCAPWRAEARTAGTPARTVSAFDPKPGPGRSVSDSCLDGRVGTRLRGRAGKYLERLIDMGCSYVSGAGLPTRPTARLRPHGI